jgi:hypothetical protein
VLVVLRTEECHSRICLFAPLKLSNEMKKEESVSPFLVAVAVCSLCGLTGFAWAGSSRDGGPAIAGLEYAQNDDGSDVVVPPIRDGVGPGGQQAGPQTPGGFRVPAPPLPPGYGNFCYFNPTQGAFGPINPVGAPCSVAMPNGVLIPGRVGVAGRLPPVLPFPGSQ